MIGSVESFLRKKDTIKNNYIQMFASWSFSSSSFERNKCQKDIEHDTSYMASIIHGFDPFEIEE